MTDEYELLPADELEKLREEIRLLKANPFGDSEKGKTLLQAIEELTATIKSLLSAFESAQKAVLEEAKQLKPLNERFDEIVDQNEKIASGIVALADMLNDLKQNNSSLPSLNSSSNNFAAASPSSSLNPSPSSGPELNPLGPSPSPDSASSPISGPSPSPSSSSSVSSSVNPSASNPFDASNNPPSPSHGLFGPSPSPDPFTAPSSSSTDFQDQPRQDQPGTLGSFPPGPEHGLGLGSSSGPSSVPPSPGSSHSDPLLNDVPKPPEKKKLFGLFK